MKASIASLLTALVLAIPAAAQGLPQAAHDNIHKLFDNHAKVKRTVTLTETGYIAVTESDDPQIAKTLRSHVSQMQDRLDEGLFVRRWDPAYEEMVRHYKDLNLKTEATEKGLRVVMTGKTPEAIKIAQNHAQIVSKFAEKGWPEHDVKHPAVATTADAAKAGEIATGPGACCQKGDAAGPAGTENCKEGGSGCGKCQKPASNGSTTK
jgi:hypothetical protein